MSVYKFITTYIDLVIIQLHNAYNTNSVHISKSPISCLSILKTQEHTHNQYMISTTHKLMFDYVQDIKPSTKGSHNQWLVLNNSPSHQATNSYWCPALVVNKWHKNRLCIKYTKYIMYKYYNTTIIKNIIYSIELNTMHYISC